MVIAYFITWDRMFKFTYCLLWKNRNFDLNLILWIKIRILWNPSFQHSSVNLYVSLHFPGTDPCNEPCQANSICTVENINGNLQKKCLCAAGFKENGANCEGRCPLMQFERWELKGSKCYWMKKQIELFCIHPSNCFLCQFAVCCCQTFSLSGDQMSLISKI